MDRCHTSSALLVAFLAGQAVSVHAQGQSTEPFPAQFELSSLLPTNGGDGSNGVVINGIDASDWSGGAVSSAGDVNGDSIDDLIIGATGGDPNSNFSAGESYVVFGGQSLGASGSFELSQLDGSNGFVINGINLGDRSGRSVASAGDVNGDGIDDLVIGASSADPHGDASGESYVVFGALGIGASGSVDLASLDGSNGFAIHGTRMYDFSGYSVSSAGDVNGDGFDDLLIGAWGAGRGYYDDFCYDGDPHCFYSYYVGQSYVVFGETNVGAGGVVELSDINGTNGVAIDGRTDRVYSGMAVSRAGDVNGDGFDDVIIGAKNASRPGMGGVGECYVVFGAAEFGVGTGGALGASSLDGSNGFTIWGIDSADMAGKSVSSAGDVNGDGIDDFLIGAIWADPNGMDFAGESYVVFGAAGIGASGSFELSLLNGPNGFVLNGFGESSLSGRSVSSAGDVNGDGIDDLIIGAYTASPIGSNRAGQSYVVFGSDDLGVGGVGTGGVFELASLNGVNGFMLNGIDVEDKSGQAVSSAGDVNDDGIDDLIIGSRRASPNGNSEAGESYVVFGRDLAPCVPDLNSDGILDNGDIGAFIAIFLVFDLAADLNGDGVIDNGDIGVFIELFLAGC